MTHGASRARQRRLLSACVSGGAVHHWRPWQIRTSAADPNRPDKASALNARKDFEKRRAAEGRKAAKAKGVVMGRPPALTPHQTKEAQRRLSKGESCRSIAKSFDCHIAQFLVCRSKATHPPRAGKLFKSDVICVEQNTHCRIKNAEAQKSAILFIGRD